MKGEPNQVRGDLLELCGPVGPPSSATDGACGPGTAPARPQVGGGPSVWGACDTGADVMKPGLTLFGSSGIAGRKLEVSEFFRVRGLG